MRRKKPNIFEEDFDKTQYVEKELIDKVSLWMLRMIFKLGGKKEFLDRNNCFDKDSVAYFLDLGKYVEMDRDDFNRNDVFKILQKKYSRLEQRKRLPAPKILTKNIKQISKLMDLNQAEEQILEFATIFKQYDILSDASQMLGRELNSIQTKKAISEILNIPLKEVDNAFKPNAKLVKSSVVSIEKGTNHNLEYKIDVISDDFIDNILNLDDDISAMLKEIVRPSDAGTLELKDYKHLSKDIDILLPYLENALHSKQKGVNVLFYGLPGTGKTELAKTISSSLNTKLYEISYADEDGEAISGKNRLKSYKIAQSLLVNQDIMLVYDEAEDIFDSRDNFFMPKRQSDKAWLNKILENNTIPTIWITNNINSVDNAMIRRFDIALEVPIPNKSKREEIIKNYSNDLLDEQSIKTLAQNENIAPALITRAAKVISAIKTKDKSKAFTQILNNTLKAQGYQEIKKTGELSLPSMYDPRFINTTTDLEKLTVGIKEYQNARVCLYGPAGTGKSAFGRYIAQTLDKPLLLKKGSDLISMWVGGTEKNIANAFEEAREEKAVLVFDEVDSFLADRTGANQSWEVTQVNEMLVQMENFDGIFIATTNLMDNLDPASLRRFDLKLEFDYLKSEQAWEIFKAYCKELNLAKPSSAFRTTIKNLRYTTPGDFAAITRQNRFRPIRDIKDFIKRLEDELMIKKVSSEKIMGFVGK